MKLLAARAESGTTVITVTHHLGNVDQATKILIMGDGEVVWFGTRIEALVHFNVHRLADIYVAIEDQTPGIWASRWRELAAQERTDLEDSTSDLENNGAVAPAHQAGQV
jgi:ABC-type multidrug transport system ATPase subunit